MPQPFCAGAPKVGARNPRATRDQSSHEPEHANLGAALKGERDVLEEYAATRERLGQVVHRENNVAIYAIPTAICCRTTPSCIPRSGALGSASSNV